MYYVLLVIIFFTLFFIFRCFVLLVINKFFKIAIIDNFFFECLEMIFQAYNLMMSNSTMTKDLW